MSRFTLYRANGACSMVIHNVLRELSLPFDAVVMKGGPAGYEAVDGTLSNAEYRKIHHAGYVPSLRFDDQVITEVPAILTYLSSLAPERKLLGLDGLAHARVVEWMNWLSGSLHGMAVAMYFRPQRFTDDEGLYSDLRLRAHRLLHQYYQRIDDRFATSPFLVGDSETVADYYVFVFWRMGLEMEVDMREKFPNYGRFARRMEAKESVIATMEAEGLEFSFTRP